MKEFSECVKTHKNIKGKKINVYGCWDDITEYNDGKAPDFYDVYDDDGVQQFCMNEGDPFYSKPTKKELEDLVESFFI